MSNQAMEKRPPQVVKIEEALTAAATSINAVLPKHLTPERMLRIAVSAVGKSDKLMKCAPESIVNAVVEASEMGLEPSSVLGHAYLVPYKGRAQLIIGYRGLIELAMRSGKVRSIAAEVVYAGDIFEYELGNEPKLRHVPNLDRQEGAQARCVYAIAHFHDGAIVSRVLTVADVDRAKKSSAGANNSDSPWKHHWGEMARKTAVRNLAKYLPLSPELSYAVAKAIARAEPVEDMAGVDSTTGEVEMAGAEQVVELKKWQSHPDLSEAYIKRIDDVLRDGTAARAMVALSKLAEEYPDGVQDAPGAGS